MPKVWLVPSLSNVYVWVCLQGFPEMYYKDWGISDVKALWFVPKFTFPTSSPPLPSEMKISKQHRDGTFDTRNTLTPVCSFQTIANCNYCHLYSCIVSYPAMHSSSSVISPIVPISFLEVGLFSFVLPPVQTPDWKRRALQTVVFEDSPIVGLMLAPQCFTDERPEKGEWPHIWDILNGTSRIQGGNSIDF